MVSAFLDTYPKSLERELRKADTGLSLEPDRVAFLLKNMNRAGQLMTLERAQAQRYADILDTVRYSMGRAPI